jgi:hypothetical protein
MLRQGLQESRAMQYGLKDILEMEVAPALGCTEGMIETDPTILRIMLQKRFFEV